MMDYCARESTLCEAEEVRTRSIKNDIQEAKKVLMEMQAILCDFEAIVIGQRDEGDKPKEANCICDDARIVAGLAYTCLQRVNRIRESIV